MDKVYGYLFQQHGNKLTINFNDVFSEEEKAIVVRFKLSSPLTLASSFKVSLKYDDVVETLSKISLTEDLYLSATSDKALYEAAIDKETVENAVFFTSNDMFQEVMALTDSRNLTEAKSKLEKAIAYLKAYVEMFPTSERLTNQLKQMNDYLINIPNMDKMDGEDFRMAQKMSKATNYMMQKRKM